MAGIDDIMDEYDSGIDKLIEDSKGVHETVAAMHGDVVAELQAEGAMDTSPSQLEYPDREFIESTIFTPRPRQADQPQPPAPRLQAHVGSALLEVVVKCHKLPTVLELVSADTGRVVISHAIPASPRPKSVKLDIRVPQGAYSARVVAVMSLRKFSIKGERGKLSL